MLFASVSHTGYVRENNEDTVYIPLSDLHEPLMIVADGIGGHNAGEVASHEAVNAILECFSKDSVKAISPMRKLEEAVKAANLQVYAKSRKRQYYGMGTTLTMAMFADGKYYIAHIGDSRAYKINKDQIVLLTQDHTLVAELVKNGGITQQQAQTHPQRNIITRSIGTELFVEADYYSGLFEKNDALLLCSDGLTQHVGNEEIYAAYKQCKTEKDFQKMLDQLLSLTLKRAEQIIFP